MLGLLKQTVCERTVYTPLLYGALAALLLLSAGRVHAASPGLQLSGVSGELQDNLHAHVALGNEPCELPNWRERATLRNARRGADNALRALGYYNATVTAELKRS